ncbi:hypothetical protein STEG23_007026 [Scotinomys teguina]
MACEGSHLKHRRKPKVLDTISNKTPGTRDPGSLDENLGTLSSLSFGSISDQLYRNPGAGQVLTDRSNPHTSTGRGDSGGRRSSQALGLPKLENHLKHRKPDSADHVN